MTMDRDPDRRRPQPALPAWILTVMLGALLTALPAGAAAAPEYQAEIIVQAADGDLDVDGYSVPTTADWNADGLVDLIVGEGGGGVADARIRIYLNSGSPGTPVFTTFTHAQTVAGDLVLSGSGCLGVFPRVVDWNEDQKKDLLVGTAAGQVLVFLNVATDAAPVFGGAVALQVGPAGSTVDITVGARATPSVVDWDADGDKDLLVGALDGRVRWYENTGTAVEPAFETVRFVQDQDGDLMIASYRSSPLAGDFDGDNRKDLICGETGGQLLFFANQGTDAAPVFGDPELLYGGGVLIDLAGSARSRPCSCDWNADGVADLVVGGADGLVHLYLGAGGSPAPLPDIAPNTLDAPFPNPFNPQVTVTYTVERPGRIELAIHDLIGRRVRTLVRGPSGEGPHAIVWNGRDDHGQAAASGTYLVRLRWEDGAAQRKITLLR